MLIAAISISVISLVLAACACWRVAHRREATEQIRAELRQLAARHKELAESAAHVESGRGQRIGASGHAGAGAARSIECAA
jgi:hypothetical protein